MLPEEIYRFLKDLLDPDRYGYAVTEEVRQRVREILYKVQKNESLHRSL